MLIYTYDCTQVTSFVFSNISTVSNMVNPSLLHGLNLEKTKVSQEPADKNIIICDNGSVLDIDEEGKDCCG
jgi:hypothetical protein